MRRLAVMSMLVLAACGGDDENPGDPDAGVDEPDAGIVDPSDELFRPDHVLEVEITMAAADWALMREEPETLLLPHVTCAEQPTEEPYHTYHADLAIDGTSYGDVGIRKKGGFGSISSTRPGLKLDVHEFVDTTRVFGLKHLTLNNNNQDDTRISQCLGYALFAEAGVPASRCNFAHVTVNGEDLGVYSNVETIKDNYLRRNFGDDSGNLYESGGDFTPGSAPYFQPKKMPSNPDCSDLDPVVDAVAASDAAFPAAIAAVVDVDELDRYLAMEVITDHWDGYGNNRNNFYFYHDPSSGLMKFLPWGIDNLFTVRARSTRPDSVFACGSLPWRLYDVASTRAQYLDTLRELLDTVWDEPAILAEITRMQALIQPFETADLAARIQPTRDFVSSRRATLEAELDGADPVWPYPAGEASCRIVLGSFDASFATTWDTLDTFGVGSGNITGTIQGIDVASSTLYASAGFDAEGKAVVQLFAPLPDGDYTVIFAIVNDTADLTVGAHPIDLATVASFMTFYDPPTDTASGGGLVLPGTFTLTSASTTSGQPITGSITGEVMEL